MTSLVRYQQAKAAIAACRSVDEAKDIHDKAEAMRAYALQANDKDLEADAAEIRIRAERRLGELLVEAKKAGQLRRGPDRRPPICSDSEQIARAKLDDAGIGRKLSGRAQKLAAVPKREFDKRLNEWRQHIAEEGARITTDLLKAGDKAQRRAAREAELAGRIQDLPDRKYGVVLADPEWRYEPYSRVTGMDRAADNHYPTSDLETIKQRPVVRIAADDCILFLWATVPMLPQALEVMEAWGFDYKSHIAWIKNRIGTGHWFRNKHELLLVGTRGSVPAPAPGTQFPSAIEAPVGAHSAKPERFLELIEAYFPNLPKIELNRRGPPRPTWDAWGNEAAPHLEAAE
jgi:N6-adenosine-specific RNA methylase IME4